MEIKDLTMIIDNIPLLLLLVNSEREVQEVNNNVLDFVNKDKKELLGLKGGEALDCAYTTESPQGCGFGPNCKNCMIKHTVLETFKNNKPYKRINTKLITNEQSYHVILHTTPIAINGQKLVLVCLEDITDKKDFDAVKNRLMTTLKNAEDAIRSI